MHATEKMSGLTRLPSLPRVERLFGVAKSRPNRKRHKSLTRFEPYPKSGWRRPAEQNLLPYPARKIATGVANRGVELPEPRPDAGHLAGGSSVLGGWPAVSAGRRRPKRVAASPMIVLGRRTFSDLFWPEANMRVRFSPVRWRAAFQGRWFHGRGTLAVALLAGGLLGSTLLTGCSRNEQDGTASGVAGTGAAVTGSGELTTGPGGEGAGMTGTEGDTPADNPASQASEAEQKAEQ